MPRVPVWQAPRAAVLGALDPPCPELPQLLNPVRHVDPVPRWSTWSITIIRPAEGGHVPPHRGPPGASGGLGFVPGNRPFLRLNTALRPSTKAPARDGLCQRATATLRLPVTGWLINWLIYWLIDGWLTSQRGSKSAQLYTIVTCALCA